jgi:hypothetical protein
MLLYSRLVVSHFIKKDRQIKEMLDTSKDGLQSPSKFLIVPLLKAVTRVKSEMDTNAIWDDPSIVNTYTAMATIDKSSTQYTGYYCPLVAGFDKMRYWSPVRYLADVLTARNVITMTSLNLMGFVCFAGLETNGTFLLSGIIDDALMCHNPKYSTFANEVNRYGIYAALIFGGCRKNKDTGTGTCYGSSKLPRHQYHNRGTKAAPIAGNESLAYNDGDQAAKDAISEHCNKVTKAMVSLCDQLRRECYNIRMRAGSQTKIEPLLKKFFEDVQRIAGKGVGHIYALNFCQVAALFGFLPMEMVTWAAVDSKSSGAYNAINLFYQKNMIADSNSPDLREDEAQKHFDEAVSWISGKVSYNFTPALAENILCELQREKCEETDSPDYKESPKKDVLYMYKHRNSVLHPLYRWKTDVRGRVTLQVLAVSLSGNIEGQYDVMVMKRDSIPLVIEKDSGLTSWTEENVYVLAPQYCAYLL